MSGLSGRLRQGQGWLGERQDGGRSGERLREAASWKWPGEGSWLTPKRSPGRGNHRQRCPVIERHREQREDRAREALATFRGSLPGVRSQEGAALETVMANCLFGSSPLITGFLLVVCGVNCRLQQPERPMTPHQRERLHFTTPNSY